MLLKGQPTNYVFKREKTEGRDIVCQQQIKLQWTSIAKLRENQIGTICDRKQGSYNTTMSCKTALLIEQK